MQPPSNADSDTNVISEFQSDDSSAGANDAQSSDPIRQGKVSKRRRGEGKSKRPNWSISDLGLDAGKRAAMKKVFEDLAPKTQNDQVAVVAVELKKQLKKQFFDGNEIASGLRIVGAKIPANLIAVFGNMRSANIADVTDGKLEVTVFLEDHVSALTPKAKKAA